MRHQIAIMLNEDVIVFRMMSGILLRERQAFISVLCNSIDGMAEVSIIAGRRGEAYMDGRIVARIGQWDVRAFPGGDWDGSCECEWYKGNDEEAFGRLTAGGTEVVLILYDYNEARHEGAAVAMAASPLNMIGDVATLEMSWKGTGPIRHS
jgi:hypothetical protein